ncbi:MAG: zf-TFIIB domain-containing protein, partial [Lentisphaerae bacterium]|nr:zf-TFIIB domain-containing protein [Lentisphaerota bacterium]
MKCPKCQAEMEAVTFEAAKINRCVKCKGLWFDEFELSDLKEVEGSEAIDTGDAKKGAAENKIDRIA